MGLRDRRAIISILSVRSLCVCAGMFEIRRWLPLLLFVALLSACSSGATPPASEWGPLAVLHEEDVAAASDASGGRGSLVISDTCVTLSKDKYPDVTLVWRSGEVSWDADQREIVFQDITGDRVSLGGGDEIEVGGEATIGDTSEFHGSWLAEPDSSCPQQLFTVHSVRVHG